MTARMKGWTRAVVPEGASIIIDRWGPQREGEVAALFSYGQKDYYLGGSPMWQMFRVTYRMAKRPFIAGGAGPRVRLHVGGTARVKRPVSAGTDALSSSGSDAEAQGNPRKLLSLRAVDNF